MNQIPLPEALAEHGLLGWLRCQARIQCFASLTLAGAVTPRVYDAATREATASNLCTAAWQSLPGYFLASILAGAVLTHVIAVTAASYGLSRLALEAVIRVHVIELLPLAAALFVALRTLPATLLRLQEVKHGPWEAPSSEVVACFVANFLAVWILAVASSVATLVVAYLVLYGFTLWGLDGYARVIGQVFSPLVAATVALKMLLFALAVGLTPLSLLSDPSPAQRGAAEMQAMARLLFYLVLIEGAALGLKIL